MEWEVLVGPVTFLIVFGIIAAIFVAEYRSLRALAAALAERGFVAERGLALMGGLKGTFKGRRARLRHKKHGKSGPWTTFLHLSVAAPRGFRFRADEEHIGTAIIKALGGEDVILGDEAFDRRFRVRTNDPDRVTFALTPDARASLVEGGVSRIAAQNGDVVLELHGKEYDADILAARLAFLETMAVRLEATR